MYLCKQNSATIALFQQAQITLGSASQPAGLNQIAFQKFNRQSGHLPSL